MFIILLALIHGDLSETIALSYVTKVQFIYALSIKELNPPKRKEEMTWENVVRSTEGLEVWV